MNLKLTLLLITKVKLRFTLVIVGIKHWILLNLQGFKLLITIVNALLARAFTMILTGIYYQILLQALFLCERIFLSFLKIILSCGKYFQLERNIFLWKEKLFLTKQVNIT